MNVEKALESLKTHVLKHSNNKYQNSIIDSEGSLRVPQFTLLTAVKYITRYLAKSGEKNGNPEDLLKACHFLLFEMQAVVDAEAAKTKAVQAYGYIGEGTMYCHHAAGSVFKDACLADGTGIGKCTLPQCSFKREYANTSAHLNQ
jgi:hypothetical protein